MNQLRILHITPWFKSPRHPSKAPFVLDHVISLQPFAYNEILHIEIEEVKNGILPIIKHEKETVKNITINAYRFLNFPNAWKVYELLCFLHISRFIRKNKDRFDIVNFYIAYPNAVFIQKFIKKYPKLIFTIYDVWSSYHFGFHLPKNSKGRKRIENIFSCDPNLFVISSATGKDIQNFSSKDVKYEIIPGIVDSAIFNHQPKESSGNYTISSINSWSKMKNPDVLIRAFKMVSETLPNCNLILGGGGDKLESMKTLVKEFGLSSRVEFPGILTKNEVAKILSKSNVYCQSSNYETFSLICVEALSSGTPVVATNIGGMKDFITPENGVLVDSMEPAAWATAILNVFENLEKYDMKKQSDIIKLKYSSDAVGRIFYNKLLKLIP
jgi:glycosyltransferase involved in cell wall biosynthesis